jgi:phosphoribosylanthranilate isomerase
MSRVKVKICGITRNKDLVMASEAGADAVGVVVDVPSSPRNLSLDEAEKIIKNAPIFVKTIAVTVPKSLDRLIKIYEKLKPDILQIHGNNLPNIAIREKLSDAILIKAVQAMSNKVIENSVETANTFDAILLDSSVSGKYGGTGKVHDWGLSKRVREAIHSKPLVLAGGLKPENVKDAIRIVQPYAVDVSSGVESQLGIKDPRMILEFIKNVKEA